jgi:DNA-binding transcriptional LysR family regulator
VTLAATNLHVQQSPVSHQVNNLEEYFGTRWLHREGAMVALSEHGTLDRELATAVALVRRGVSSLKPQPAETTKDISVRSHFALKWLSADLVWPFAQSGFRLRL